MHKNPTVNAAKIKSLRENKGWSQSDLERESGIAQAHISRIEANLTPNVSAVVLGALAQTLGVSVDFLLGLTSNPLPSPNSNHLSQIERLASDPLTSHLLVAWAAIEDDNVKRSALTVLEHIATVQAAKRNEKT